MAEESKKRNQARVREGAGENEHGQVAPYNKESPTVEKIALADIQVVGRRRNLDLANLRVIIKSMLLVGLQTPITVRRDEKLRAEVSPTAVGLVLGYYRVEAAKALRWEFIDAFVIDADETEVRIRQLVENLCRADLTALERAEDVAELVDIVRETRGGQVAQPGGRQPHDRGISWASRTLGFTREEVRRSTKIAGISPEAKAKAKEFRLDNNQTALLEIATEDVADGQLAKIEEIAIRNVVTRARLRNRRGANQVKAHNNQVKAHNKKSKAHTRRSTPKSSTSDDTAETATPPAADSPAIVPETFSGDETAAEIEQLKAELAEKTEKLRQTENELRQARLAASRASERAATTPPSVPMHDDADLDIPAYLARRPLSAEEEKAFAALDAAWSNAPAIVQERFRATILGTVKNAQDPAQT
jgi:ParB/RepB/Spo0J family partition protein